MTLTPLAEGLIKPVQDLLIQAESNRQQQPGI
jgi:hypothetical protein